MKEFFKARNFFCLKRFSKNNWASSNPKAILIRCLFHVINEVYRIQAISLAPATSKTISIYWTSCL